MALLRKEFETQSQNQSYTAKLHCCFFFSLALSVQQMVQRHGLGLSFPENPASTLRASRLCESIGESQVKCHAQSFCTQLHPTPASSPFLEWRGLVTL